MDHIPIRRTSPISTFRKDSAALELMQDGYGIKVLSAFPVDPCGTSDQPFTEVARDTSQDQPSFNTKSFTGPATIQADEKRQVPVRGQSGRVELHLGCRPHGGKGAAGYTGGKTTNTEQHIGAAAGHSSIVLGILVFRTSVVS